MAWQRIGAVSISPITDTAVIGPIEVPTYGGVEIKIRQVGSTPFRWGYGLLSYRTGNGLELGTLRVWPRPEFCNYLLGAGLTVSDNTGVLIFEPRSYNLRWIMAGFSFGLEVLADLASDLPADRYKADGFAVAGNERQLIESGNLGRLSF
jgi:hypothetical protein